MNIITAVLLILSTFQNTFSVQRLSAHDDWEIEQSFPNRHRGYMVRGNYDDQRLFESGLPLSHDEYEEENAGMPSIEELEREWNAQNLIGNFPQSQTTLTKVEQPKTAEEEKQAVTTALENYKASMTPAKKVQQATPSKTRPSAPVPTGKKSATTTPAPAVIPAPTPYVKKAVAEENKTTISFGGYIKPEAYWDTRQTVNLRDGQFLFYPAPLLADIVGDDIASNGEFEMVAIQTRINAKITGPKLNGTTQITGFIEGDFFGTDDTDINGFHMRHAMAQITHNNSSFLFGQYWHPIFVEECNASDMVSFNVGVPFESFTRNPQMRYEYKSERGKIIIAALAEVDFVSTGTLGPNSIYLRNSMVPIIHGQGQIYFGEHVIGGAVDYRRLKPRLVSNKDFKVDEHVNSVSGIAFATFKFRHNITLKAKFIYASNDYSYDMLGGYAISSVDPVTGAQTYTAVRNLTVWGELSGGKVVVPGIFAGFLKNIGSSDLLAPIASVPGAENFGDLIFGRGQNIDWAFRVSPRIYWNIKNLQIGAEFETTHAVFGTIQQDATVCPTDPETNYRLIVAFFYYF